MKKLLFIIPLILFNVINLNAQTILYSNDFTTVDGLVVYDIDGDGLNWFPIIGNPSTDAIGLTGNFLVSQSWDQANGALTPDNLVVTPEISIPANLAATSLSFKLASINTDFPAEHISVYVAPATTSTIDQLNVLTPVFSYTLTANEVMNATTFTVDVSAYNGQTVKIGIRHHECTDQDVLFFDDLVLSQQLLSNQTFDKPQFIVSPNPAADSISISNTGNSDITALFITDISGKIVKQLQAEQIVNQTISISDFSKGVYFMSFKTDKGTVVERLIKK